MSGEHARSVANRFEEQTAVVTESTRGISEATARRLARERAAVLVTGLDVDAGHQMASEIQSDGGEAVVVATNLGESGGVRTVVETASEMFGETNMTASNAAIQSDTTVADATLSHWNEAIRVNLRAYWLLVRKAMEHTLSGAQIVNVSSNHARRTMPGEFPYDVLKARVDGMNRAMALDVEPLGIRSNVVTLGCVLTERTW